MMFKSSANDSKRSSQDTIRISIKSEEPNEAPDIAHFAKYGSAGQLDGVASSGDQLDNIDRVAIQMMMGLDRGQEAGEAPAEVVQVAKKNSFSQYSDLLG